MSDDLDPVGELLEFALVFAISVGASLTSFSLWERLEGKHRDTEGPGR